MTKKNFWRGEGESIEAIKERLQQIAGGKMVFGESPSMPQELREQFWRDVLAFEEGPFTTEFERLKQAGVVLPDPQWLDDGAVAAKLREVIAALARLRVTLHQTDHLSDRELYAQLWQTVLHEAIPSAESGGVWHIDMLGSGSEEETRMYLRFYAPEEFRRRWQRDFPDFDMPPRERPPFDRDRHLPQPTDSDS
jgi:hypothetical protein